MLRSALIVLFLSATSSVAETVPEEMAKTANSYCKEYLTKTGSYQSGLGSVEVEGDPIVFDEWSSPHNTMVITFPDQVITLTTENVASMVLADYIATTVTHKKEGFETFAALPLVSDEYQFLLVQPFATYTQPDCFFSPVKLP